MEIEKYTFEANFPNYLPRGRNALTIIRIPVDRSRVVGKGHVRGASLFFSEHSAAADTLAGHKAGHNADHNADHNAGESNAA